MKINIFGRIFYFLTDGRQYEKLYDYLKTYWINNPVSIAALCVMIAVFICAFAIIPVVGRKKQILNRILAAVDAAALYMILVVSRDAGTREWRHMHVSDYLAGSNGFHESEILIACLYILYFIPFGMLLRRAFETDLRESMEDTKKKENGRVSKKKGWICVALTAACALVLGILIEVSQYVLSRGVTYMGHVLAYLVGALIGALIMGLGLQLSENV